jgi:AcrR family transcriptional regulator
MFNGMKKRPYHQKRRAAQQEKTALRIVEAAMALHEEVGPRDTTIAAIAARAGVQRLTVYRHFPDADAIFRACTSHWFSLHPPPDPVTWQAHGRPRTRVRHALAALYTYYRETAGMWKRAYRDVEDVDALKQPMAGFEAYLHAVGADLAAAWNRIGAEGRPLEAFIALATRFRTWETLDREAMDDAAMAEMMASGCSAMARGSGLAHAQARKPGRIKT